jgi:hypothetical protein
MTKKQLPEDYAIVLLQIGEDGEDDFSDLAELMQVENQRLWHVVLALQHKGLVTIEKTAHHPSWVSLSSKGKRMLRSIWPEAQLNYGY